MNSDLLQGLWLGVLLSYSVFIAVTAHRSVRKSGRTSSLQALPESGQWSAGVSGNSENPAAPEWFSVPGGRIELGDTGFYILLETNGQESPYHGYSPEGYLYGQSQELNVMKAYIEKRARERSEFNPPPSGWTSAVQSKN